MSEKIRGSVPYYVDFRVLVDNETHWYQAKFVHHRTHKNHNCAVLGITNIDELMAQKVSNEEILKQNLNIIEGVASKFASVLYLNLVDGSFTYHIVSKNRQEQYEKYWDQNGYPYRFFAVSPAPLNGNSLVSGFELTDKSLRVPTYFEYQTSKDGVTSAGAEPCMVAQVERNKEGHDFKIIAISGFALFKRYSLVEVLLP